MENTASRNIVEVSHPQRDDKKESFSLRRRGTFFGGGGCSKRVGWEKPSHELPLFLNGNTQSDPFEGTMEEGKGGGDKGWGIDFTLEFLP